MGFEDLSDAIAYCRVSTTRQAKDTRSLESYLARFRAMGFSDDDIYWDVDSGTNPDRRGYQLILALIRSGRKHRVFVPEFSRFSREPGSFEEVIADFEKAGATIQPLDGRVIAFESPDDRHFARTQIVNAAYERDKILYRSKLGHKFLRAEGRPFRVTFGLRVEKGKLYHNLLPYGDSGLTYAEVAIAIVDHFIGCGNLRQTVLWINQQFKPVEGDVSRHHQNLKRWLLSEQLRGHTEYFGGLRYQRARSKLQRRNLSNAERRELEARVAKREVKYNTHEPLITPEQDQQIRRWLDLSAKTHKNPQELKNPLVGLLFCAECGGACRGRIDRQLNKSRVYCQNAYLKDLNGDRLCSRTKSYGHTLDSVEAFLIERLCEHSRAIATLIPLESEPIEPIEITNLREEIYKIEALHDPDFLPVIQIKRDKLRLLESQLPDPVAGDAMRREIALRGQDPDFWNLATFEEKLILYRAIADRIVIDRQTISVEFRF